MNKTKFYTCRQNNSGGYDIQDENVDKWVCVEAKNIQEAKEKLKKILNNYREFCPCCGQRWNDYYLDEEDGYETPCIYEENYKEFNDEFWCRKSLEYSIIIYYLNGTKERYELYQNLTHLHEDKGE